MQTPLKFIIPALCAAVLFSGCSLGGYIVGSIADPKAPRPVGISGIDSLSRGTTLIITKTDFSVVQGPYMGHALLPDTAYAQRFDDWRVEHRADLPWLPAIGTVLKFTIKSKTEFSARQFPFAGLDSGKFVILLPPDRRESFLPREMVTLVRDSAGGTVCDSNQLNILFAQKFPPRSTRPGILIGGENATRVAIADIGRCERMESGSARWYLLALGAVVDAIAIGEISTMRIGPMFPQGMKW